MVAKLLFGKSYLSAVTSSCVSRLCCNAVDLNAPDQGSIQDVETAKGLAVLCAVGACFGGMYSTNDQSQHCTIVGVGWPSRIVLCSTSSV
jgi:hypothetical protein